MLSERLAELLHEFGEAATLDDAWTCFTGGTRALGFDVVIYGWHHADTMDSICEGCLHNLPASYIEHIDDGECVEDPLLSGAARTRAPFAFATLPQLANLDRQQRALVHAAPSHGLHGGVVIPVPGPRGELAYVTLHSSSSGDFDDAWCGSGQDAHLLSLYFHHYAQRLLFVRSTPDQRQASLTPRECEALRWTAAGKTAWEIATILSVSERTVNFHLQNAMHKLGAVSKTQAVARALSSRLIRL